ncbi:MAG: hypothetical protein M3R00_07005, partial [Pseudomonadota bacterium]|nr:hypothetical protein [Pseudomonadota bacterium]
ERIVFATIKMKHPDQKVDDTFECIKLLRTAPGSMLATLTLVKKLLSITLEPYFSEIDKYHLLLTLIHQAHTHHCTDMEKYREQDPAIKLLFHDLNFPENVYYFYCDLELRRSIFTNKLQSEPELHEIQAELILRLDEIIEFSLLINNQQLEDNKKVTNNDRVFNSEKHTEFELEVKTPKDSNQRAVRTALKKLIDKPVIQLNYWGLYSSNVAPDPELEKLLKYSYQLDATVEQFIDQLLDYLPFCALTDGHHEFMLALIYEMPQNFTEKNYNLLSYDQLRGV